MRNAALLLILVPASGLLACGSVINDAAGDAAPDARHLEAAVTGAIDGAAILSGNDATIAMPGSDGGSGPGRDGDSGTDSLADASATREGGSSDGGLSQEPGDAAALRYVDAGLYRGDGSFFADAGADLDGGRSADGGVDAVVTDAAPGCGPLAACCSSLSSGARSLCTTVAGSGDATNCAAELAQLQSDGECMGVTVLAAQVQVGPILLVSDGTTLFWLTSGSPAVAAMPVDGGSITLVVDEPVTNSIGPNSETHAFLAVGSEDVYLLRNDSVDRIPKNGTPASLVNESGALVLAGTTLGDNAFWVESLNYGNAAPPVSVKSAPLAGGPISTTATFTDPDLAPVELGVTNGAVFVAQREGPLFRYPRGGGAVTTIAGASCVALTSDADAVYCAQASGSNLAISTAGAVTELGPAASSSYIVFDDTYAYWANETPVGTIVKAPKTGVGTATVVARDASPTAIAVDGRAIYWSDQAGYIKSVAK